MKQILMLIVLALFGCKTTTSLSPRQVKVEIVEIDKVPPAIANSCKTAECSLAQAELRTLADKIRAKAQAGLRIEKSKPDLVVEVAHVLFATQEPNQTAVVVLEVDKDPVGLLYAREGGRWVLMPEAFETPENGATLPDRRLGLLAKLAKFEAQIGSDDREALMFATQRANARQDMAVVIYGPRNNAVGFVFLFGGRDWMVVPEEYRAGTGPKPSQQHVFTHP
jgi:hypothetical protein